MPDYNKHTTARRGDTGHIFHTPLYDATGTVLDLSAITFGDWEFTFTVTEANTLLPVIFSGAMVEHPDQVNYENHVAYIATESDMENDAGDYWWQITATDPDGVVTSYPLDDTGLTSFGTFKMQPKLG
jgi:hypothetical protein